MGVPRSKEARLYFRCALQRMEDAQILLRSEQDPRTTGAVYLAGYGIECILKALILSVIPTAKVREMIRGFRGNRAHDFGWLRDQYLLNGGSRFPREMNANFIVVNNWSTDLRYIPRALRDDEAQEFMAAALVIIRWANARL